MKIKKNSHYFFSFRFEYWTPADLPGSTLLAAETEITANSVHVHATGGLGDGRWKDLVQHRHDWAGLVRLVRSLQCHHRLLQGGQNIVTHQQVLAWMLLSLPIVISPPFLVMFTGTVGFTSSMRIWICSSSLPGSRSSSSILSRLTNSPCNWQMIQRFLNFSFYHLLLADKDISSWSKPGISSEFFGCHRVRQFIRDALMHISLWEFLNDALQMPTSSQNWSFTNSGCSACISSTMR